MYTSTKFLNPEFFLWNFETKATKKFTLLENIEGGLIDAKPWKTNQIAFFGNSTKVHKPKMIIYDIEKKSEVVYNLTGKKEAMLSEVLVVNGEKDLVLFETLADKTDFSLFNLFSTIRKNLKDLKD